MPTFYPTPEKRTGISEKPVIGIDPSDSVSRLLRPTGGNFHPGVASARGCDLMAPVLHCRGVCPSNPSRKRPHEHMPFLRRLLRFLSGGLSHGRDGRPCWRVRARAFDRPAGYPAKGHARGRQKTLPMRRSRGEHRHPGSVQHLRVSPFRMQNLPDFMGKRPPQPELRTGAGAVWPRTHFPVFLIQTHNPIDRRGGGPVVMPDRNRVTVSGTEHPAPETHFC